jgi:SAM-dependent methyltransferase
MPRILQDAEFRKAFDELIVHGHFNEEPGYYPRYRSRYSWIAEKFAMLAPAPPCSILDIGGGQMAVLCKSLWDDDCTAADIGGEHLNYVGSRGVRTARWNLCSDEQPFKNEFDFIFFSEVIEHLPLPGHVILERLRKSLKPNGLLLCTTPNLYRLRNVVYMATGTQMFDNFRMPDDHGLGHILEYTKPHLEWQLQRAGFCDIDVSLRQFHHQPHRLAPRLLSWLFYPLFILPRFRDNLVAIARAPSGNPAKPAS